MNFSQPGTRAVAISSIMANVQIAKKKFICKCQKVLPWSRFFFSYSSFLWQCLYKWQKNPDQIGKSNCKWTFFAIWTFAIIEKIASALVPGWEKFIFSFSPLVS